MRKLIPHIKIALTLLIIILFIYGIITAKKFLYPVAFGALFAYLLYPIVNYLEKHRIPRILSILTSILLVLSVIAVTFFLFYTELTRVFEHFDKSNSLDAISFRWYRRSSRVSCGIVFN